MYSVQKLNYTSSDTLRGKATSLDALSQKLTHRAQNFLRQVSPFRWEYYKDSFEDFTLDPQLFEVHIGKSVQAFV